MIIFPYTGIDELLFSDDLDSIKRKLAKFKKIVDGHSFELGKKYPSLFIEEAHLYIVFFADDNYVRYFQVTGPVFHAGHDLYSDSTEGLTETYKQLDPNIKIELNGFDSPAFGFSVNKSDDEQGKNDILVYSKRYSIEPEITPEDIINYYGTQK